MSYIDMWVMVQGQLGPDHWSLFVGEEGFAGDVYQVKGDQMHMTFQVTGE